MSFWRVAIDETTGKVLSETEAIVTPSKFSRHLGFSRDGKRMIYVQTAEQANIQTREFDPVSGTSIGDSSWVTSGDRLVIRPDLSPDQKQFVMRLPGQTQEDIVVVNREGTNWRELTDDKFFDRYPRWSPDGKKVVFTSDRSGTYEIWTIDTDGTNLRQITFEGTPGTSFPIWSPDGQKIIFRKSAQSFVIDANKTWAQQTPQALPEPDKSFVAWDWSPDGTKLVGHFTGGMGYFSFATNRYEMLLNYEAIPMWLPDSRRVIFASEGKAFVVDSVTKKVRELFGAEPYQIRSVGVSKDGRLIYYTAFSTESDIWMLDLE